MIKIIFLLIVPITLLSQNSKEYEIQQKEKFRSEKYATRPNNVIIRDAFPIYDQRFNNFRNYSDFRYSNPRYSNPDYYNPITVIAKPLKGSIGLSKSLRLYGLFFTIGEDKFLVADLMFRPNIDNSEFYSNINIQNTIQWNDKRLKDVEKGYRIYAGYGQRMGLISPYISVGIGSRVINYQFIDDLGVLNGSKSYSFPKYGRSFVGVKFGSLIDFNKIVIKFDIDPINPDFSIGAGFRISK